MLKDMGRTAGLRVAAVLAAAAPFTMLLPLTEPARELWNCVLLTLCVAALGWPSACAGRRPR
jgi:hypothetical protein